MTSSMKISIIGAGYVGLCTGVGFALLGHRVTCVDIDERKVRMINKGIAPVYEKGLEEKMQEMIKAGRLEATTDCSRAVENSDVTFIAVGTPDKNGGIDLSYVIKAAKNIGSVLSKKNSYHVIVMKSTVVPGTTESIMPLIEEESGKTDFGMCVNPEFLREGNALDDFMNPDRIVIGSGSEKAVMAMEKLYSGFAVPVIKTDMKTAEMIKYASNAFLATKISFMNEIGNLCKKLGIDTYAVADGMGRDKRIGREFLNSGIGFGGSCFRKDSEAILAKSGGGLSILKAAIDVNSAQPKKIVEMLEKKMSIHGKTISILGLAFKEDTDDIRDSPSIIIIKELAEKGARIKAYDPKASENMSKIFPGLEYAKSAQEALNGADACLILTGWEEFKKLSDNDFSHMKSKIIIEGRKILDRKKVSCVEGVCW